MFVRLYTYCIIYPRIPLYKCSFVCTLCVIFRRILLYKCSFVCTHCIIFRVPLQKCSFVCTHCIIFRGTTVQMFVRLYTLHYFPGYHCTNVRSFVHIALFSGVPLYKCSFVCSFLCMRTTNQILLSGIAYLIKLIYFWCKYVLYKVYILTQYHSRSEPLYQAVQAIWRTICQALYKLFCSDIINYLNMNFQQRGPFQGPLRPPLEKYSKDF